MRLRTRAEKTCKHHTLRYSRNIMSKCINISVTGWFLMNAQKYELTVSARRLLIYLGHFDIWHLKLPTTKNFVKIEVCGKNVRFWNISENTKEISLIFRTDLWFALIFKHFIGLSWYSRLWKIMPQIKEPVSNKFNQGR